MMKKGDRHGALKNVPIFFFAAVFHYTYNGASIKLNEIDTIASVYKIL